MDIRTKLIFTLVVVALASMGIFGAVMLGDVEERIRDQTLEQLLELAEAKSDALHWILIGWQERTGLISSRTQLRARLADYNQTGDPESLERMQGILTDAVGASRTLALVQVFDDDDRPVVTTTGSIATPLPSDDRREPLDDRASPTYLGVEFLEVGAPQVSFLAPMVIDGTRVGTLMAVFVADELVELASHYHGLGRTGEVLLVVEGEDGVPRTLHPTRHAPERGVGLALPEGPRRLSTLALSGDEETYFDRIVDYRGENVWAAVQYLPETGWGLIIKLDEEEELEPIVEFRADMMNNAVILAAFAILAGFLLGLRFAQPITDLADVANQVRQGDMSARAKVVKEDEVGLLARTFNEMAGELEDQMELLHEYRKFFDVSIDLLCLAGTDGFFKRVNPAFERELGYTEEQLLGCPFFEFVHPDDVEKTEHEVVKLSQGIPTISFSNRYRCADGSYKVLRWTSFPEPETGLLYAVAHVMGDAETDS